MDNKELLAIIGKLYLDVNQITAYAETLRVKVTELENQLTTLTLQNAKIDKSSK